MRFWRSDAGSCLHSFYPGQNTTTAAAAAAGGGKKGKKGDWTVSAAENIEPAPAGSELTEVLLLPGGKGLMATTGDARLLFLQPTEGEGGSEGLAMTRQLIGNHDEVTDIRFIGPMEAPTHLALSTNSHEFRLYDLATLSCTASCIGHRDAVLCLDVATTSKGKFKDEEGGGAGWRGKWESRGSRIVVRR